MRALLRFADFFVSTSMFTACCALGLCFVTERLILDGVPLSVGNSLHRVVFGSTLIVYNLPRLVAPPYGKPRKPQPYRNWYFFFFLFGIGLLASGILEMPLVSIGASTVLCVFAFGYFLPAIPIGKKKRLRDYGLLKIVVLTAVWVGATAVLPMQYWGRPMSAYPFELIMRFVFMFALCVVFDIRDMQTDIENDIATLPYKLGVAMSYRLVYGSVGLFMLLGVVQYYYYPDAGRFWVVVTTSIATVFATRYTRKRPGHSAFVALIDGMMLLYAILLLLVDYVLE